MWKFEKSFICPKDALSLSRYEEYVGYYKLKHDIAKEFNPSKILEIGVRAGYSAISFLSAVPTAKYIGLDAENGQHGGAGGPWMWWAEKLLANYDVDLRLCNTQKINTVDGGPFGLIHVDGDHTAKGALHDLEMCWPLVAQGGVMLVDDYDYLTPVKRAVDKFCEKTGLKKEYRRSIRGEILFVK